MRYKSTLPKLQLKSNFFFLYGIYFWSLKINDYIILFLLGKIFLKVIKYFKDALQNKNERENKFYLFK